MSIPKVGDTTSVPIIVQKGNAKTLTFKFEGDISGNTFGFYVAQYSGASNDIARTATSATYSGSTGLTTIVFDLTTSDTNLSYEKGLYTVHDSTSSITKADAPLIVKEVPKP